MKKHFACLFAATLLSLSAVAQTTYPTKPVKLIVGAGAGGGTDIIARMLAEKMTESLSRALSLWRINPVHPTPLRPI